MDEVKVFNITEAAAYLGMSRNLLRRAVEEELVPFRQVRKRLLFSRAALDDWLKGDWKARQEVEHSTNGQQPQR